MQKITLSIIVPVYNEEKTVYKILLKVFELRLPKGISKEIIVVNDGSTDKSKDEIKKAIANFTKQKIILTNHKNNIGKGAAIRTGLKRSTGDIITFQDADMEYDPRDLLRLLTPILERKELVVYGTRLKQYPLRVVGQKRTPLITHFLGNKFLSLVTNLMYGSNLSDMETCYKMFRMEVLKGINIKSKRFEFEPEITAKVLKKGYKIYETSINVKPRGYNEGKKITWRDGFAALWTLVKYRFTD